MGCEDGDGENDLHSTEGLAAESARQLNQWANIELNWRVETAAEAPHTPGSIFDGNGRPSEQVGGERCDIPRVKARRMSPSIFAEKFYLKGPVLGEEASSVWPATERWRRAVLMERHGSQPVKVRALARSQANRRRSTRASRPCVVQR